MNGVAAIGRATLGLIAGLGRLTLFALATIAALFRPPFYLREMLRAVWQVVGCRCPSSP